jgi:D-glycero-alpha-D-manno-heptose-7-phosphate kinase
VGGTGAAAGAGGFLMFLAEDKSRLRRALNAEGLEELRFKFDFDGSKVLFS